MTKLFSPMPELEQALKELRLLAIKEKLAERTREAIEKDLLILSFWRYCYMMKLPVGIRKNLPPGLKKARFKLNKTIESFDFTFNNKIDKAQIMELAKCNFIRKKVCALVIGPCGTGKTHIAQAIGFCAIKNNIDVLFYSHSKLMQELQSARALNNYEKKIQYLTRVPLLIIDDFGLKPLQSPEDEHFHYLINERYENAATIITSNLAVEEWIEFFQNKLLGIATIDSIRHGVYIAILNGKSYRSTKPKKEGK